MAVLDLITLAEYKVQGPVAGTGRDLALRKAITAASRMLEREVGRRIVFRAPPEVATKDNVVAPLTIVAGAIGGGLITQPSSSGRILGLKVVDANNSITGGTVTVVGTVKDASGASSSRTVAFDLTNGLDQQDVAFWTAFTSITVGADLAGAGAGDTLQLFTSLGYIEYHTPGGGDHEIWPLEWPVQNVLEFNEDPSRGFASGTSLVRDSDFIVTTDTGTGGKLTRTYSSIAMPFLGGWRSNKLVYAGGYWGTASVPQEIKDVCFRLTRLLEDEIGRIGMLSRGDATGNWTRFGAAKVTAEMRDQLEGYYRGRRGSDTGHRDWDQEAS